MSSPLAEIRKRFPDEDGGRGSKCNDASPGSVAATIGSGRQAVTLSAESASDGQHLPKPTKDRKNDTRQPSYSLHRYLASQNPYESLALGLSSERKSSKQKGTGEK
ncbi:hypothetical protein AC579_2730 [Pseudocercospora musae]|uniref:Uncharacterized protein n=1 Tax=Pseudocercospora musae TaxID=113226 RepID=A0A139IVH4_9PEZI|nr:hypothetical protein AC579_2730 [Pseudocercospora musae]